MKHLGLFEGIGGFSLAARWADWHTPIMVEWDLYCQAVLKKNFPYATIFGDIHEFDGRPYAGQIDVITGGFPCQPYSHAGKRAGNDDDRALWPQMLRVIREVRPRWVVGENVAGILSMDGGRVLAGILSDLEDAGYSAEIYSIPVVGVGAPHQRERIWIVAHAMRSTWQEGQREKINKRQKHLPNNGDSVWNFTDSKNNIPVADADLQRCGQLHAPAKPGFTGFGAGRSYTNIWSEHWLPTATRLCRMDDGLPAGMDGVGDVPGKAQKRKATGKSHRIEALGNAIVPEIAYQIFQAINEYETQRQ